MIVWQRRSACFAFLLCSFVTAAAWAQTQSEIRVPHYSSVHPIIGTAGDGNTFPGATLPFGMIQWSPDTGTDGWYHYKQDRIYGFSLTHLSGAGCTMYADFPVLPFPGGLTVSPHQDRDRYTVPFDHANETAHPGYYSLTLANGTEVEITVTDRAGIAHFHFPDGTPARLLVNAGGSANSGLIDKKPANPNRAHDGFVIRLVGNNALEGTVHSGSFCGWSDQYVLNVAMQFEQPFVQTAMWNNDTVDAAAHEETAHHAGAWLDFGNQRDVTMKVGLSFVSVANAQANLEAEIPGWDFNTVHQAAQRRWSDELNRFSVEGGTPQQQTIFYTGLYHMLLAPNLFSDRNRQYIGFDDKVHALAPSQQAQYANYSDWDIYRDVVQFQALLDPARSSDMAQSLVNDAEQSGWLPRWPAANDVTYVMGGDSPAVLLSDMVAFGARNFDAHQALHSMLKAATQLGKGFHGQAERLYLEDELKLGYVPIDHDTLDASRTLEYASDDFAVAQMAKALGDTSDYNSFMKRAGNWQNLFDPATKWIRPKNSNGTWLQEFDPEHSLPKRPDAPVSTDQDGFEEGNTWQYSFMIPFDYPRLIHDMGGDQAFVPRLDRFFSKLICWGEPCFNMANEPDFVVPYAYEYTNQPWKTDDVVTRIEQQTFGTGPDGIPGNDDLGATSGVYVWNALGLYPGVPGVGGFFLGTPMFREATVHFADGRTLVTRRSGDGVYVNSIAVDGQPYSNLWLPLDKLPVNATTTVQYSVQSAEPASTNLKPPPNFRP
ncbi:MAG TPA: GH92 family glycosyl hydrolase [Acidobacteriaceae bacterium]|nr:GH92 family glycosyl hydrolase [Acidobacteriaceae bacterium]